MNDELTERLANVPDFDEDASPLEPPAPPRQPSQVYSVRIPVGQLDLLRRIAAERNEQPSVLMRRWVLERLEAVAPDGQIQTSFHPVDDLINRVIDLEQQVGRHQKELEEQASAHTKELETVVERVLDVLNERFEIRSKPGATREKENKP